MASGLMEVKVSKKHREIFYNELHQAAQTATAADGKSDFTAQHKNLLKQYEETLRLKRNTVNGMRNTPWALANSVSDVQQNVKTKYQSGNKAKIGTVNATKTINSVMPGNAAAELATKAFALAWACAGGDNPTGQWNHKVTLPEAVKTYSEEKLGKEITLKA